MSDYTLYAVCDDIGLAYLYVYCISEWHNFEKVVINMATLWNMVRNKCKILQQYKDSVQ